MSNRFREAKPHLQLPHLELRALCPQLPALQPLPRRASQRVERDERSRYCKIIFYGTKSWWERTGRLEGASLGFMIALLFGVIELRSVKALILWWLVADRPCIIYISTWFCRQIDLFSTLIEPFKWHARYNDCVWIFCKLHSQKSKSWGYILKTLSKKSKSVWRHSNLVTFCPCRLTAKGGLFVYDPTE